MNATPLPRWDDPESYGNVRTWSYNRWRWEFFRRRSDLQEAFTATYDWTVTNGMASGILPRGQRGCALQVNEWAKKEFGYYFLPDPTVGDHPEDILRPWTPDIPLVDDQLQNFAGKSAYEEILELGLDIPADVLEALEILKVYQITPKWSGRTLMGFDLEKPLTSQLEMAKRYLQRKQVEKLGYSPQVKRRHPAKWFGYLRTLDARSSGATWAEIATLHPATAQTEQTARDIWQQASDLCFNF